MTHRGMFREGNLRYIPVGKVSTPVYQGATMIGRDFPDGSWFRTYEQNGQFFYNGKNADAGLIDGGPYRSRGAASRLAVKALPQTFSMKAAYKAKKKGL